MQHSDKEFIEYLCECYGEETVLESLNEYSYGDTDLRINKTGGSDIKGPSGVIRTLPGLALTTLICWPLTLFFGIGILHARLQQRWEKRHSWMQQLFNPNYWAEYYANIHKGGNSTPSNNNNAKTDSTEKISKEEYARSQKVLEKYGYYYDEKDQKVKDRATGKEVTKEEALRKMMSDDFKFYWITFSNGEIVRVRAESESMVKEYADKIVDNTGKVYDDFQNRKNEGGNIYDVLFDDNELAIWVAKDKDTAKKEALKSRVDLSNTLNKGFSYDASQGNASNGVLLFMPKVSVVRLKKATKVERPIKGKYDISDRMPENELSKSLKKDHIYEIGNLHEYKAQFNGGVIVFPGGNDEEAKNFVAEFFNKKHGFVSLIMPAYINRPIKYVASFVDGDYYTVGSDATFDAQKALGKIRSIKEKAISAVLSDKNHDVYKQVIEERPNYNKLSSQIYDAKNPKDIPEPEKISLSRYNSETKKYEKISSIDIKS